MYSHGLEWILPFYYRIEWISYYIPELRKMQERIFIALSPNLEKWWGREMMSRKSKSYGQSLLNRGFFWFPSTSLDTPVRWRIGSPVLGKAHFCMEGNLCYVWNVFISYIVCMYVTAPSTVHSMYPQHVSPLQLLGGEECLVYGGVVNNICRC